MMRNITLAIMAAALLAVVLSFTSAGLANDQVKAGDAAPEFELSDQDTIPRMERATGNEMFITVSTS